LQNELAFRWAALSLKANILVSMSFEQRLSEVRHRPLDIALAALVVFVALPLTLVGSIGFGMYLYFFKLSPPVAIPEP
jgi:hypothetical protein